MIRPIGNRILVKPLHQDEKMRAMIAAMRSDDREFVRKLANEIQPDGIIALVTTTPPVVGEVVAVGKPFCDTCRSRYAGQLEVGDCAVYHMSAGMEITIDGVPHISMRPDDVLLIWRPDPVPVKDFTHLEFSMSQEPNGTPA